MKSCSTLKISKEIQIQMIIFAVEESGGNTFSSAGGKSPSRKQATLSLAEMQFSVFPTGKQYLHFANRSARTSTKRFLHKQSLEGKVPKFT